MSQTKPFFIPQKEFDLINQMNEELIDEIVGQSVDIYKVNVEQTDSNLEGGKCMHSKDRPAIEHTFPGYQAANGLLSCA